MRELEPRLIDMVTPETGTENNRQGRHEAAAVETVQDCGDSSEEMVVDDPLITFVLLSVPESAGIARQHVGAAFEYRGLSDYADEAKIIASELVTNAIQHAHTDVRKKVSVLLMPIRNPDGIAIVVKDESPYPPVMREVSDGNGRGHGLQIIEALAPKWGWSPEDGGKAVWVVLETPDAPGRTRSEGNQAGGLG